MQFLKIEVISICVTLLIILLFGNILAQEIELFEGGSSGIYNNTESVNNSNVLVEVNLSPKILHIIPLKEKSKQEITEEIMDVVGKENVKEFKYTELIAIDATDKELKDIKKDPYVKKVIPQRSFRAFLQESVGVVNANNSWNLQTQGLNLTGKGQSACILDTGINYNHPDLASNYLGGYDFVNNDNDPYDDNGHGTHVSGIIAANGGIRGIAPSVGIVSVKVLASNGIGNDASIIAGIEWCIDHKNDYNISVISMSLGSGLYANYCNEDPLASSINLAVAKNISVIVASGNDMNYTHISSPACVENSTAVGMSYDKNYGSTTWRSGGNPICTDVIANSSSLVCWGNRNALIDLIAPGAVINSTNYLGDYEERQGTSMSAPMVAAGFAILNQYLTASYQNNAPNDIESIFKNAGDNISDDFSNSNYTLINIYSALLSVDLESPNVSLEEPSNNLVSSNKTLNFNCNISDWQLKNITLIIWNSTKDLYYNVSSNLSGISNSTNFSLENIDYGVYTWNCLGYDNKSNSAFAISNYSFEIKEILSNLSSPLNNTYLNQNNINFTCYSETNLNYELRNVTFYLWSEEGLVYNETAEINGTRNSTNFNYGFFEERTYFWNCLSFNNVSNQSFAKSNFTFTHDNTAPVIYLITPSNEASYSSTNQEVIFNYNISELNIKNCSLIINNELNFTNSSLVNLNQTQEFIEIFSVGTYTWSINCSDLAENIGGFSLQSFTVSAPAIVIGGSSGGGGGSSAPREYSASSLEMSANSGYSQELGKNEKISFELIENPISNEQLQEQSTMKTDKHTLIINKVEKNRVNITIRSTPIYLVLEIGQEKKFNISSSNYYDLYIKLNSIKNYKANITIKEINELINPLPPINQINETNLNETEEFNGNLEGPEKINYLFVVLLCIIAFAIIILLVIYFFNHYKIKISETHKRDKKIEKKMKKISNKKLQ